MKTYTTHSARDTQDLAASYAQTLLPGERIALAGDLGAGKTTFVQGLLGALGAEGPYTSPTFTLVKSYVLPQGSRGAARGIRMVYHMDAYRIGTDDVAGLGWHDMIDEKDTIILVEWPERIAAALPTDIQTLSFTWINEDTREIVLPQEVTIT